MNNALVNTIPHSGTHLVTTILNSFGTSGTQLEKVKLEDGAMFFLRLQRENIKSAIYLTVMKVTFEDIAIISFSKATVLSDLLVELGYETSNAW